MKKSRFLIAAAAACILAGSAAFAQQSPGTLSYASSIAGADTGQAAAASSINQERSIGNISRIDMAKAAANPATAGNVKITKYESDIGGVYMMAAKSSGLGAKLGFTEQPRLASTAVMGLKAIPAAAARRDLDPLFGAMDVNPIAL
jgi:hypothetical protein